MKQASEPFYINFGSQVALVHEERAVATAAAKESQALRETVAALTLSLSLAHSELVAGASSAVNDRQALRDSVEALERSLATSGSEVCVQEFALEVMVQHNGVGDANHDSNCTGLVPTRKHS